MAAVVAHFVQRHACANQVGEHQMAQFVGRQSRCPNKLPHLFDDILKGPDGEGLPRIAMGFRHKNAAVLLTPVILNEATPISGKVVLEFLVGDGREDHKTLFPILGRLGSNLDGKRLVIDILNAQAEAFLPSQRSIVADQEQHLIAKRLLLKKMAEDTFPGIITWYPGVLTRTRNWASAHAFDPPWHRIDHIPTEPAINQPLVEASGGTDTPPDGRQSKPRVGDARNLRLRARSVLGRSIVQSVKVKFELTAIGFDDLIEWQVSKGFKKIIEVTRVGFECLPGFLQSCLREEELASQFVRRNARTPLPTNLMHTTSLPTYHFQSRLLNPSTSVSTHSYIIQK